MKKITVILLVLIVLMQWYTLEEQHSLTAIKEGMCEYEYDKAMLGMSILRVMKSEAVCHNFGRPIYPVDRELQYVWTYIKLLNSGTVSVQIEPEDFTLSAPGKDAVNHDSNATDSMLKSIKPISLKPNEQNIGVLIFAVPESKNYTLYYDGPNGKIEKGFVVE